MATNTDLIQKLYVAYFNRPADVSGLNYWLAAMDNGATIDQISKSFNAAAEYTAAYAGKSPDSIVDTVYMNLFGRHAEGAGLDFWSPKVQSGAISVADLVKTIAAGAVNADGTVNADGAALANKVSAAEAFTTEIGTAGNEAERLAYASGTAAVLTAAKAYIAGVTTDASLAAAVAGVHASAQALIPTPPPPVSVTSTLTTAADTVATGSGDDVINALVDAVTPANSTLTLADQVNGGTGADALNVTISTKAVTTTAVPVAVIGVETFNVRAVDGDGSGTGKASVDASQFTGLTAAYADRASQEVDVTSMASGGTIGIKGNGTVANGDLHAGYLASATVANLAFDGGVTQGAVVVSGAGLTTANITSTGDANALTSVDVAGAKTISINATTDLDTGTGIATSSANSTIAVTGAGNVALGTLDTDIVTVTATGNSGGISATVSAAAQAITGGSGNDVITTGGVVLTGSVDAGAGTGDKLIVTAAADVAATPAAKYSNFEIVQNNAAATLDLSLFTKSTFTSVVANASGAGFSKMTAAQAAAVTNKQDNAGATFSLADSTGTADVLTVTLKNGTANASADLTGVTVDGFETMNVVTSSGLNTNGTFNDTSALSFTSANKLTALNLTGAAPVSVSTANIAKAVTINAAGLTAVPVTAGTDFTLTLAGALIKGSTVTGSANADSITLSAIAGTSGDYVNINGGAGNDLVSTTAAILNNTSSGTASFKLDGGAGTDTLKFTEGGVTLVDANFQFVTNFEKVTVGAAGAVNIVSGGFFDTNFKTTGVTITDAAVGANAATVDLTSFTGKATVSLTTGATTQATLVNGGGNDDTITVVGASLTTGNVTVAAGAGNDTIKVTSTVAGTGIISVDGGAGQDAITLTNAAAGVTTTAHTIVTEHAGQSTVAAADTITGFTLGDATNVGVKLDFDNAAVAASNATAQALTGYTSAELTYTITGGLLTFAGTKAAALTAAQEATLAQAVVTTADTAVAFTITNSDATVDTYVFEHSAGGDSLVKLVGVTALGLGAADVALGHVNVG